MVCTNSTKQLLMKTPPAVLILHLKRFQVVRSMFRKLTRHVSFPLVLDISSICSAACKVSDHYVNQCLFGKSKNIQIT